MNFGYKKIYIDGTLRDASSGRREKQICPGTGETIAELAWAGAADANAALESARDAFLSWSSLSHKDRSDWIKRLRDAVLARGDELRSAVMYEMGKPWDATAEDLQSLLDALEFYPRAVAEMKEIELADSDPSFSHRIVSRPVGVVVAILAWNFPLLNIGFKLGPALASGCTIVLKPSEKSAVSAYLLGEIAASVNFPKGVFNIICGSPKEVGEALSTSKIPRLLTMIGSSAVGRKLMAQGSTSVKRMSMELGGNAPAIVFEDADLHKAAKDIAALKFGNAGQICVSPNRIYVHQSVIAEFLKLLKQEAAQVYVGFGEGTNATMGPLIDEGARSRVMGLVREALESGATLLQGGKIPENMPKGYFYEPTILSDVKETMRISCDETFGPVAAVRAFLTEEEVIAAANKTDYGLVAYAYTKDRDRTERLAASLEFGEVMLNGFKWGINLPHGGIKESGVGKDCSILALDDYLVKIRITSFQTAPVSTT